jgi:wyosine [tRNA(Phe)-imidazoG37] synthetase (radical SAM superfamily)
MIAFGPVPSRRLGFSLGINHIPPKHCSYSCVYCQVGRTNPLTTTRQAFYLPDQIVEDVEKKISTCSKLKQPIDYLTLVPDGEPTLDINLGELIDRLKNLHLPVAVISNASMIEHHDVQEDLLKADWVSLKIDAVDEETFHKINRPHRSLSLSSILTGINEFRSRFSGILVTETMLVSGINDSESAVQKLANFLCGLNPEKAYISIPTRPPAESWVKPPDAEKLQMIIQRISERVSSLDLLFDLAVPDFFSTGNLEEDILSIIAVHPLREEDFHHILASAKADWDVVNKLLVAKKITQIQYQGTTFYLHGQPGKN